MLLHMVADKVAGMVAAIADNFFVLFLADMLLHMHMVNGMMADMVADKEVDKLADMVVGHGCFDPNLTRRLACLLSKLCKFIKYRNWYFEEHSSTHKYLTFKCKDSTLD